jgi:hypothetical protein
MRPLLESLFAYMTGVIPKPSVDFILELLRFRTLESFEGLDPNELIHILLENMRSITFE